jgi:Phage tail lysozyme
VATVIDSLTLTLGLDASQYKAGQAEFTSNLAKTREAAASAAKDMEARGAQAAQFFSQIKTEALGLIGVLVGGYGLVSFAKDATKSMVDLGNAAANSMTNVRELDAFGKAIERNGGSATVAADAFVKLQTSLTNFKLGLGASPEFLSTLSLLGAAPTDTPEAILGKFAAYAKTVSVAQANIIGARLGLQQDTMNALRRIGEGKGLPAELQRSKELGLIDPHDIKVAQDFQHAVESLGEAAYVAGEKFFTKFAPGVSAAIEQMATWIGKNRDIVGDIEATIAGLIALKVPLWILRWLGLAAVGETAVSLGLAVAGGAAVYEGAHIGGTNEPQLTPEQYHGTPTNLPAGYVPGSSISPPAPGTDAYNVMQQTRAFWLSKGFTQAQVAGILAAGPAAESGFNPNDVGDGGTSYGLYQHHAERMRAMFARYGQHPTAQQQNEFAWSELNAAQQANLLAALHAAKTPQEAAEIWTRAFEKPRDLAGATRDRGAAASKFLPPPAPGARTSSTSSTNVNINAVNVHTQATDATGMASAAKQAMLDSWMTQANRGLA